MKPLPIVVTVVAAVLVVALGWMLGPGASWWLEHVDGVTGLQGEKLAVAVDAVRGRILAVATGLAALLALYYTARNTETARRTFQLGERGHDTDRYGKAVEQLGSDQAPVRLGGLYALEQLAQDNPRLRQTVVDVFSAYLRMPYLLPKEVDREEKGRISTADRAAQKRKARRTGSASRGTLEERQVRLTVQRILTEHLRWSASRKRRWWSRAERSPDTFWPGMRLDLTGATLLEVDLRNCRIAQVTFDEAYFTSHASFVEATFTDQASFARATFTLGASFDRATFTGRAVFDQVISAGTTSFHNVTFTSRTRFLWANLARASFDGATFTDSIEFPRAIFSQGASFHRATFAGRALFSEEVLSRVSLEGARVLAINQKREWWRPGWRVERDGKGGGVLRRDVSPTTNAGHETTPEHLR